jgi:CheY-like chemotaxis protein/nitrogen-specific signal transduction histidine kinase
MEAGSSAAALGERAGMVWIVRDVTELARVDEMKNEFVSVVSHELRTPLTAIKGFTDLILEGDVGEITAEQREFLEIVQTNSDRLVALINDMLDISRIESGRIALALDELSLAEAVDRATTAFRPMLAERSMHMQTELAPGAETVIADDARLQQILANLISNACKYTPAGGWITLRATPVGDQVAVSISDTGVGIPPEALPRIFSKFYRVDHAMSRDAGGTGLGLAITKSLVELHGGRVSIASRPEVGTTVRFTLPAPRLSGLDSPEYVADGGRGLPPRHSGRVLLAEDDPDSAHWLQRSLASRGYDVTVVPDGLAAVVRAIEMLPDAIILDVNMPRMGAAEALPQLKENPGARDIPVIVLTGTVPDARPYFLSAGAADFFTKPPPLDELDARLRQLIRRERVLSDT